jgi:hypothetical protein
MIGRRVEFAFLLRKLPSRGYLLGSTTYYKHVAKRMVKPSFWEERSLRSVSKINVLGCNAHLGYPFTRCGPRTPAL